MSKTGSIYALIDPRDNAVRYVGQTVAALSKRLGEHLGKPTNDKMRAWVYELKSLNMLPVIELLETVDRSRLNDFEDYWLGEMAYRGFYLLNNRLGQPATDAYLGRVQPKRPR